MMLRDEDVVAARELIAQIETQVPEPAHGTSMLRRAWNELVERLALGPTRRLQRCPHCGVDGTLGATLCLGCWSKLSPLPELARAYERGE